MCDDRHRDFAHANWCGPFSERDIIRMKRFAGHFMRNMARGFGNFVPYNVEDLENIYLITVPLPGRSKDEVTISLINKHLTITAKKPKIPEAESQKTEKRAEGIPWNGFTFIDVDMDIPLPIDADENNISSKMANGLLRITLDKKPAKNIDVNEESNN
jgi:HSP20 family molecular chaperone IbpA